MTEHPLPADAEALLADARETYARYLEANAGAIGNPSILRRTRAGGEDGSHGVRIALFALSRSDAGEGV